MEAPQEPAYTETTDGIALLALVGKGVFSILEKACPLDLTPPGAAPPCLVQGPVFHIPCQIVVLHKDPDTERVLVGFSRGYGQGHGRSVPRGGGRFRALSRRRGRLCRVCEGNSGGPMTGRRHRAEDRTAAGVSKNLPGGQKRKRCPPQALRTGMFISPQKNWPHRFGGAESPARPTVRSPPWTARDFWEFSTVPFRTNR